MYSVAPYWKKTKKCKNCKQLNEYDAVNCKRCGHDITSSNDYTEEYGDDRPTYSIPAFIIAGILIGGYILYKVMS